MKTLRKRFWLVEGLEDTILSNILRDNKIVMSKSFLQCGDIQMANEFRLITGVDPHNKHLILSPFFVHQPKQQDLFLSTYLCVNHDSQAVTIHWKSKSGKVYYMHDEVDCSDIEFHIEGIDVKLLHEQLYPRIKVPFKLTNLSYDLVVVRLSMYMEIEAFFRTEAGANPDQIIQEVADYIEKYNAKAEKNPEKYGAVHNYRFEHTTNSLLLSLDLGYAGVVFTKGLLKRFSKMDIFAKVELK
jgi:hypothetical protein